MAARLERLIHVVSAKGGVGKTSLALAVACHFGRGARPACIVDVDFSGTSLEIALGGALETPEANLHEVCSTFFGRVGPKLLERLVRPVEIAGKAPPRVLGVSSSSRPADIATMKPLLAVEEETCSIAATLSGVLEKLADHRHVGTAVLDHAPGLLGLADSVRYVRWPVDDAFHHTLLVVTPDRQDVEACLDSLHDIRGGDASNEEKLRKLSRIRIVFNRSFKLGSGSATFDPYRQFDEELGTMGKIDDKPVKELVRHRPVEYDDEVRKKLFVGESTGLRLEHLPLHPEQDEETFQRLFEKA